MTDLKPANFFLCGGDLAQVKIVDFGIARRYAVTDGGQPEPSARRRMAPVTSTGIVVGTPEYMAPEQARAQRDLTPAADLFSLGCVLYECLTGQPPFSADHLAVVLTRILFEDPTPVQECRPGVPESLVVLLGKLLRKDPKQRVPDAVALQRELADLGDVIESALAPTLAMPRPKAVRFAEDEQGLFSIVLASSPQGDGASAEAITASAGPLPPGERRALLQAVEELGTAPDFLANGSLIVTVPATGSAQDQALRAARAALLIQERWPQATVSMATGRGSVRGRTAVGEVVEVAARSLRASSQPQAPDSGARVWVDSLSAKLLEGRFALLPRDGGALLLGEEREADDSRLLLGKPTPCVGREPELVYLEGRLAACIEASEAQAVLVTAPPGLGKSRLRHELLRRLDRRTESLVLLIGRADLVGAGAPYGVLRAALHKLCGLSGGESLAQQQESLRARLAPRLSPADQDRVVVFLGELCGIPFPEEGMPMLQAARQQPKIMRDRVRRAFLDWLAAECAATPVLIVLDDLQWSDELTVALLDEALAEQAEAPLYVLAFARPEVQEVFPKLWHGRQLQLFSLKQLSRKACERLIQQVLGNHTAPELVTWAIEQSSGNALFLEETAR